MMTTDDLRQDRNKRRRELALDIERQVGRIEKALDDLKSTVHDLKNEEDSDEGPRPNGA